METVTDLISKWSSDAEFARDIGLTTSHVSMIKMRNSLHPKYWLAIIKAADKRGFKGISEDSLAKIAIIRMKASA